MVATLGGESTIRLVDLVVSSEESSVGSTVKIGLVFPQTEIGADPSVIREYAQAAEHLGFSHLLAFDHVLGAAPADREPELWGPYTHVHPFHEPLTLFAFIAGFTKTIGLATGVLVLPQRQTALVAKQAAQVAILSGGRLRLGVGVGWNHVEYQALKADFGNRGRRQEEQVRLLRELWTSEVVDFTGDWHRIDRAGIAPLPPLEIPIWFGGLSSAARSRAARLGDGFMFAKVNLAEEQGSALAQVEIAREIREEHSRTGRSESFGFEGRIDFADGPRQWEADLAVFESAGFDYVGINMMNAGIDSPAGHVTALDDVARYLLHR